MTHGGIRCCARGSGSARATMMWQSSSAAAAPAADAGAEEERGSSVSSSTKEESSEDDDDVVEKPADVSAALPGFDYDCMHARVREFALRRPPPPPPTRTTGGEEEEEKEEGRCAVRIQQDLMNVEGTAGAVWPPTEILLREMLGWEAREEWSFRGRHVLELGSGGSGVLGMAMFLQGAARVVCSDGEGAAMRLLRRNLEQNLSALAVASNLEYDGESLEGFNAAAQPRSLRLQKLRWSDDTTAMQTTANSILGRVLPELDTLVASDVVFDPVVNDLLLCTLRAVVAAVARRPRGGRELSFLLAYQARSPDMEQPVLATVAGLFETTRVLYHVEPFQVFLFQVPKQPYVTAFPYSRPQHDPQKLMRASLATSCLRGKLNVWQFQGGGVSGREVRKRGDWDLRGSILKAGHMHRIAREPRLRGEMVEQTFRLHEYRHVVTAIGLGHLAQSEWFLSGHAQGFEDGMNHRVTPLSVVVESRTQVHGPLFLLMQGVCAADWAWGRRRLEERIQACDQPCVIEARRDGSCAAALLLHCVGAGSSASLPWSEHYMREVPETARSIVQVGYKSQAASCSLDVARWLEAQGVPSGPTPFESILCAARAGNFAVMEMLVARGYHSHTSNFHGFALDSAAEHAHGLGAMRFLQNHGLSKCSEAAAYHAARHGNHAALEWLLRFHPDTLRDHHLQTAAGSGDISSVVFLKDRCGFPWDNRTCEGVLQQSGFAHVHVLEWAHARGLPLASKLPSALFRYQRCTSQTAQIVRFLLAHVPDMECDEATMQAALASDAADLGIVEALHAQFPQLLEDYAPACATSAIESGRLEVIEFVVRHASPRTPPLCDCGDQLMAAACACPSVNLDMIEYLHTHHYPDTVFSASHMYGAVERGTLSVIEWLACKQHVRPDRNVYKYCADFGRRRILQFLVQDGHRREEFDLQTMFDIALRSRHVNVVRLLLALDPTSIQVSKQQLKSAMVNCWPLYRLLCAHASAAVDNVDLEA